MTDKYDRLLNTDINNLLKQKKAEKEFEKRVSNGKKGGRPTGKRKRSYSGKGYSYIYVEGKQVLEHRYLMEQKLKRKLLPHEAVYFIDGNNNNLDLSNLQLGIKPGKHTKIDCPSCGKDIFSEE